MNENELDDLFKKRLEDPVDSQSYREADWGALEQLLDKRKKRGGVVYWLPVYGSVAALLLLFLGYMALRPKAAHPGNAVNTQVVNHPKEHSGTNGGSIRQQAGHPPKASAPVFLSQNINSGKHGSEHLPVLPPTAAGARRITGTTEPVENSALNTRTNEILAVQTSQMNFGVMQVANQPVTAVDLTDHKPVAQGTSNQIKTVRVQLGYRPQLALSVIAAPDINGVGSFQQSKVGTNEGLLFSVGLSRKFSVSTGAIYSVKPYITGFENYHTPYQFPTDPVNISADCRMLDIPLNFGYQIYNKHQNSISVGTGLSSYIMLHESYKFNYSNIYTAGPAQFTVPNSSGYYFGILNLNATFQHQVNSKVGYTVQPYLKLPLSNVGYSQVRLQTTGVALGITWNINSGTKP